MSMVPHILIVDDQEEIREVCLKLVHSLGYQGTTVATAGEALKLMEETPADILLTDIRLPDMSGIDLLRRVRERHPSLPVLIMTAYASVGTAVQAMKLGAADYITKPFDSEELRILLDAHVRRLHLEHENRMLKEQLKTRSGYANLIGASPQMQKVFRLISKVSQNRYPVLVLGESGTGKEIVARAVHYNGPERDRPFIPVDCGALVPTLIESELFGYVKGAFTGANRNREGLLEIANGGTVFLDEIGELPVDLQSKLLRAIQEKEIRPVGSTRRVRIDVRIIAATNRDLEKAVSDGSFRRDLFFRLNVVSIKLPPLRERAVDIPLLVEHFLEKYNRPGQPPKAFSDDAMARLMTYDWPGNVRELENCVERAVALSSATVMEMIDLPSNMHPVNGNGTHRNGNGPIRPLSELEKEAILSALTQLHGDKLLAAKLLGIGKTTLYRKLKEYAVEV
jgi:DNA-binding NtrC family response regulator